MKILITGTPGVGKSTLAIKLSNYLNLVHYDVTKDVIKNKLFTHYDSKCDTYEIHNKSLRKYYKEILNDIQGYIIDTHSPTLFKLLNFDFVFVIRCPIKLLRGRLEERKYSERKIMDNIDCEIFDEVGYKAKKHFKNIYYLGCDEDLKKCEVIFEDAIEKITKSDRSRIILK